MCASVCVPMEGDGVSCVECARSTFWMFVSASAFWLLSVLLVSFVQRSLYRPFVHGHRCWLDTHNALHLHPLFFTSHSTYFDLVPDSPKIILRVRLFIIHDYLFAWTCETKYPIKHFRSVYTRSFWVWSEMNHFRSEFYFYFLRSILDRGLVIFRIFCLLLVTITISSIYTQ